MHRSIVEAHAFADLAARARHAAFYDAAIDLGRAAWRLVERDGTRVAVEAFLKGTREESWGWQRSDCLVWALMIARHGHDRARQFAEGTLLEGWAQMRVIEVQGTIEGRAQRAFADARELGDLIESTLQGAWQLIRWLEPEETAAARDLRLVAAYSAFGAAAKLSLFDAADRLERDAAKTLRLAGESPFEPSLRTQQAILAIRTTRFDDAHAFLEMDRALREERGQRGGSAFVRAHLLLASGDESGVSTLQAAVNDAVATGDHQGVRASLNHMSMYLEPDAVRVPSSDDLPTRPSPALWN